MIFLIVARCLVTSRTGRDSMKTKSQPTNLGMEAQRRLSTVDTPMKSQLVLSMHKAGKHANKVSFNSSLRSCVYFIQN